MMTIDQARQHAKTHALQSGVVMAVGYQMNDVTGQNEPGYCPASIVGPAFVHTVIEMWGRSHDCNGQTVIVSIPQ